MKLECEVFCAGNAVMDVLARPVDGLPAPGASQRLEEVALGPGGNGLSTAVALARLGVRVALAAPVGDDRLGEILRWSVRFAGVDDSNVITVKEARTSVSLVLVESSGERRLLHFRGANAHFSACHLNWDVVKGARVFHYASAFALPAFFPVGAKVIYICQGRLDQRQPAAHRVPAGIHGGQATKLPGTSHSFREGGAIEAWQGERAGVVEDSCPLH